MAFFLFILVNAALMRIVPRWIGRWQLARATMSAAAEPPPGLADHIVLCGFGRVGSAVAEAFETFGRPYVAIERDPEIVRGLRARGIPCLYGDAASRHILEVAGAAIAGRPRQATAARRRAVAAIPITAADTAGGADSRLRRKSMKCERC